MPKYNPQRDTFIHDLMAQGYTESAASYHWLQHQKGKKTRRLNFRPITRTMLERNGIVINHSLTNKYGWSIIQVDEDGSEYELRPYLSSNNHVMYSMYGYRTDDSEKKEQFALSLASMLWVYFKDDIPAGYVVDHIDENPLHNELYNFQCITRAENARRRSRKNNQFCKGRA